MPGRQSVDLEIYGMEGIPEADQIAYLAKQEDGDNNPASKRPKFDSGSATMEFSAEDLQSQLAQHKAMMAAAAAPAPVSVPPPLEPMGVPPGFPMAPAAPGAMGAHPPHGGPYPGQFQYPGMPPAAASVMPAAYSQFYQPRPPQPFGMPPHPG